MRIVRPDQNWCVYLPSRGERLCLQRLALRHGYRIGELCSDLDCSERYLYSVFTRDIGLSPKLWMRWERMAVARRKLVGGKAADEVAVELGFSSPNNFRREFLMFHRIGPREFQRERWGEVARAGIEDWW